MGMKQYEWTLKMVLDRCIEEGDCWIWQRSKTAAGYPNARINRKTVYVSAWVWAQVHSAPQAKGMLIKAKCGNIACVSPKCLRLTTRSQVTSQSNRSKAKDVLWKREMVISQGWAKLNMQIAREIRASDLSTAELSVMYGVGEGHIYKIKSGRAWAEGVANSSVFNWRPAA